MRELKIHSDFTIYDSVGELPDDVRELMQLASDARDKAYAPYSNFTVGAAIKLENGILLSGSNQENASYPSGLCAERTVIFSAHANYPDQQILRMAIIAGSLNKKTMKPVPPCGACRQAIAEYELKQDTPIEIFFKGETGEVVKSASLANLLPLIFDPSEL